MKPNNILYYGVSDNCSRGEILFKEADEHIPELFICHPLDLHDIIGQIIGRELIPIENLLGSVSSPKRIK